MGHGHGSFAPMWMDEILHHVETSGNHGLLVFAGELSFQIFLGGAKWISQPSKVGKAKRLDCLYGHP